MLNRYRMIFIIIALFAILIATMLFKTTVVDAPLWNEKAAGTLVSGDSITPERGKILASDGSILSVSVRYYMVRLDLRSPNFKPEAIDSLLPRLCSQLESLHTQPQRTAAQWKVLFDNEIKKEKSNRSRTFLISKKMTKAELDTLRTFAYLNSRNGRTIITAQSLDCREKPFGRMAARSIGNINDLKHGTSGLEKELDSLLYGKPGVKKKVQLTTAIKEWEDIAAINGYDILTTIDVQIQDILETELYNMCVEQEPEWATAVLMDVKTGDIKAISNLDRDSVSGRIIESMNRAMRGIEPGSVLKSISMIVALEDGYVGNLDTPYKTNSWRFGNYEFHGHPNECSARDVLRYSSNIGIAKLVAPHFADNPNGFRERLRRLGFLDTLYTGIAGETPPHYPPLDPKAGGLVTLVQQTYGYGAIVPPIYICAMYNAIANAGRFVRPRIIRGYRTASGDSILAPTYVRDSICSRHNAHILLEMLRRVVSEKRGTAYTFLHDSEVPIAGKTGTAYVAKEKRPGQTNFKPGYKDHRWRNFSFCGIFPADKPRYTCMVVIGEPAAAVSAASSSGMIVRDIAAKMNARGLLGDTPDYRADAPVEGKVATPTIYTVEQKSMPMLKQTLGTNRVKTYKAAKSAPRGTVPDVRGMGIRQAVHTIEAAGYRAGVRGNGLVVAQSPAAGTRIRAGATVSLTMQ